MPKRKELKKILVLGSGPIVIGQGAEFDYSGTQAIEVLKDQGIEVVLINSNPATIMTDANIADKVYLEPMTLEFCKRVILWERPDALLPNLGGQIALNLSLELAKSGFLDEFQVELLGVNQNTIDQAEDREEFKKLCHNLSLPTPPSKTVETISDSLDFAEEIGYPVIVRPAFTLGGSGGGIATDEDELRNQAKLGLDASPINQILVEKSIAGFKEIEFEVMRDHHDNTIIVCGMENVDPVGVHTGDSVVVSPIQTLTDPEVQKLRNVSLELVRVLQITGGCNVQLAQSPYNQEYYIIEVNPRVSRSSALASKATGYPIAKLATLIAIGYTLDEIPNPVTENTFAAFEPVLDYVVTKFPRFPFDKFDVSPKLGSQMQATGEVMALSTHFLSSLLKAIRSLETKVDYLYDQTINTMSDDELAEKLELPHHQRLWFIAEGMRRGLSQEELYEKTGVDYWFLAQIEKLIHLENELKDDVLDKDLLLKAKRMGMTDKTISFFSSQTEEEIYEMRSTYSIYPVFKKVDTCAGEFEASTAYYYSTYQSENEQTPVDQQEKEAVVVLGSGPIRIGQGIEFDYSTVHALKELKESQYDAVVINNNPETISTDFNAADKLFFEPLYHEDVEHILQSLRVKGVLTQFGGQSALNLAPYIHEKNYPILGTSFESLMKAENRFEFEQFLSELEKEENLESLQPLGKTVTNPEELRATVERLGFPVMIRPSFVIGGLAMEIIDDYDHLDNYLKTDQVMSAGGHLLVDKYIVGLEVEVDALSDGEDVFIPGIMEHIERAGVHSGDSFAVYPPQSLTIQNQRKIISITTHIAKKLKIKGLVNFQFVVKKDHVYVIEVNPRSSRSVPFLSKVTQTPMSQIATKIMLGKKLRELGLCSGLLPEANAISIKAPVFCFHKIKDVDTALGPQMKSTGEAIGRDLSYEKALKKAFIASGLKLPEQGKILVTVADKHKDEALTLIKEFARYGFDFIATAGTQEFLQEHHVHCQVIPKIGEAPYAIDQLIKDQKVCLILNTISRGRDPRSDGHQIRRLASEYGIICLTALDTARAILRVIAMNSTHLLHISEGHQEELQ